LCLFLRFWDLILELLRQSGIYCLFHVITPLYLWQTKWWPLKYRSQSHICSWIYILLNWFEQEEFEDTKGVMRIRKSKNRQHSGQKKKDERTINDLQNITHKTKDRVTRTPLKTGGELRCSGRVSSSCSTSKYQTCIYYCRII
jgi:hypothetical protein